MKNQGIKLVNSYIIRRMRLDAQLAQLADQLTPFVDASYEELITRKSKLSLQEMDEMKALGIKVNKLTTDIVFLESNIAQSYLYETIFESELVELQRVNLN